jgi:predicted enzyme related to lactoylglutathione lyase
VQKSVQRVDHVAIIVYKENVEKYVRKLSDALGVTFDPPTIVESTGVVAALSWDSGLEILAPLREEGRFWDRLQRHGEGCSIIVFGVADMDEAKARAQAAGVAPGPEVKLDGTEFWYGRFKTFREAGLALMDHEMPVSIGLGELDPHY